MDNDNIKDDTSFTEHKLKVDRSKENIRKTNRITLTIVGVTAMIIALLSVI